MKKSLIGIAFLAALSLAAAYFFGLEKPAPKGALLRIGEHEFLVEIADTPATRTQGLSGREKLPENSGMLFFFDEPGDYGFWMKDMKFPIDIVWIRGNTIAGLTENVAPEPGKNIFALTVHSPPALVDNVLELRAGAVGKYGFMVGDKVEVLHY